MKGDRKMRQVIRRNTFVFLSIILLITILPIPVRADETVNHDSREAGGETGFVRVNINPDFATFEFGPSQNKPNRIVNRVKIDMGTTVSDVVQQNQ